MAQYIIQYSYTVCSAIYCGHNYIIISIIVSVDFSTIIISSTVISKRYVLLELLPCTPMAVCLLFTWFSLMHCYI